MPDMDREELIRCVKRGQPVTGADLSHLGLERAELEGAIFSRCDLEGANLEKANLRRAKLVMSRLREGYLVGADLQGANLENVDLEGANLQRANLTGANLTRANLEGADLTKARLTGARLSFAQLDGAQLARVELSRAVLTHVTAAGAFLGGVQARRADLSGADLRGANLEEADLTEADVRHANVFGARLDRAKLTGARIAGLVGTGSPVADINVSWLDASAQGDGSSRLTNGQIPGLLSGLVEERVAEGTRYLGRGDVLCDAELRLHSGSTMQIDGLVERSTIHLGEDSELIVGEHGVLADCNILGPGRIVVHGSFFEGAIPGIHGARRVVVSASGVLIAAIAQEPASTCFAFERGSRLRMKLISARAAGGESK